MDTSNCSPVREHPSFSESWEDARRRLPLMSFFSNPRRFAIDADNLDNLIGKAFEIHCDSGSCCWYLAARTTEEKTAISIRRLRLPLPGKHRLMKTIADSIFWESQRDLQELVAKIHATLESRSADKVHLHYFRPGSPQKFTELLGALKQKGLTVAFSRGMPLYRCALAEGDLPLPSKRLKSKTRNTLSRKSKKLESEHGKLEIRAFTDATQAEAFFAAIEQLSPHTWQRHSGMGGLRDNLRFRRVYEHESTNKRLKSYLLFAGDRPIAYQFGTLYDGIYNYEILGFDQFFGDYSPGQLLRLHSFDELYVEGVRLIDFGPGEYEYKSQWGTEKHELFEVKIYGGSLRSRLLWSGDKIASASKRVAKYAAKTASALGLRNK